MESDKELKIPGSDDVLRPGYQVKLGRFNTTVWTVGFGWYSASGNRPCCGWYLTTDNGKVTKPLQNTDLIDIYVIDIRYVGGEDPHRSIEAIDKEVVDIRLGEDGTEYETAGDAVRAQVAELKKLIPSFDDILCIQGVISKEVHDE